MKTVVQFADACRELDNVGIYTLFEDNIPQVLRDEIYDTYNTHSFEPMRAAMNKIGAEFCVQSLIDY